MFDGEDYIDKCNDESYQYNHTKKLKFKKCITCKKSFSGSNIFSYFGERISQESGECEMCWDYLCDDDSFTEEG